MSIYSTIYNNLCQDRKSRFSEYQEKYSSLHAHHIIPKHMGGTDDTDNITFLTVREHIIAHYLLFKIHRNPNDLRSMKMLGANLTPLQRKITGIFCRDNDIGFFGAPDEKRNGWRAKGRETMSKEKIGIYHENEKLRKEWCSKAGKISAKKQIENKVGIHNPENFVKYASIGGKAMKGIICIHKGDKKSKVYPPQLQKYLDDGWELGWGGKRYKPKISS